VNHVLRQSRLTDIVDFLEIQSLPFLVLFSLSDPLLFFHCFNDRRYRRQNRRKREKQLA
jgi:hypothetical protein